MAKNKRIETPEKFFDPKEKSFCVYEIYRKSKKTVYYLRGSQDKYLKQITLQGFIGLPAGLYLNKGGYGFGKKGVFLLSTLKENLAPSKSLELIITDKAVKGLRKASRVVTITLPIQEVKNLLIKLGRINEDNNNELRSAAGSFLSTKFPSRIKISTDNFDEYKAGEMAALLRREKVAQKLNEEDLESLNSFFPKIFQVGLKGQKKTKKSIRSRLIKNTKKITDRIFLDEVITEFKGNLLKKSLSENEWQIFLREKVFYFFSNYVTFIEKQNVSISVSYPDFVLVDAYNFVDVFEIKKPDTPLLALDESHDNYYWKPDIAKAISQIENYIDEIICNSDGYIRAVKRKKDIDIRVVRPRGYIIAGTSKQFNNAKESEDFRKLGVSLKNVNFILYDELFENLKNLRSKL